MRSIRTRFLTLMLGCVLLSSILIGGAGIMTSKRVVEEDSARIMSLLCKDKTQELNGQLESIEQSVRTLSAYAVGQLESVQRPKTDSEYVEEYTRQLELVAVNAANNTDGAVAVYFRFAPEITKGGGMFWSRNSGEEEFHKNELTDLARYDPSDMEYVGWYYMPKEKGEPVWMSPYYNKNINVEMISYVIPLYKEDTFVGVLGMDINYKLLVDFVSGIKVYDSGYAFLTDAETRVMYHAGMAMGTPIEEAAPDLAAVSEKLKSSDGSNELFEYEWNGQKKKMLFADLKNGMKLAFTAPSAEIDEAKNRLVMQNLVSLILIIIISAVLTVLSTGRIIRPLQELTAAAEKIARGDLSISISCRTKDEVGMLAESFRQTVEHLKGYIDYINGLAYRDAMTGVKNKTAYQEAVKSLEERMRIGRPEFAVAVLDINGLKAVNDSYGHDFGDMLIIDAGRLISRIFTHSPVFRVGGDEFVVLLEGHDYECYEELLEQLREEMEKSEEVKCEGKPYKSLSIARGIAVYQAQSDLSYMDVFKRADNAMYLNKADMKRK